MENYKRISDGEVRMPFKTSIFNDMLGLLRTKLVMVPAKWSVDEVLFDFKNRFATSFDPKMPEANFTEAVGLMIDMWSAAQWRVDMGSEGATKQKKSKTKAGFTDEVNNKIAALLGVSPEQVVYMGAQLERSFAQNLAGAMITPTLIRTLLSDHRYHTKAVPKFDTTVGFRLRDMLIHVHSMFAQSAPWSEIQTYVQTTIANDEAVQAAHQMILTFRSPDGMTVPLRLDYVMNTVFEDCGRSPFYRAKEFEKQPLIKEITEINIPDLSWKALISFYFSYLRRYMGGPKEQTMSFTYSYLNQIITKSRPVWPVLPNEALDDVTPVEDFFDRLALLNLVQDAALGQFGTYRANFATFIADKKYRNDDTYFQFVNKWLDALCLAVNACDAAANWIFLKAMSPNIAYLDVDSWSLGKLKDYVQTTTAALSALSLATDHPRYLLQPALLLNQSKASSFQLAGDGFGIGSSVVPSYFFEDDEYKKLNTYVVDPKTFTYVSYRRTSNISGTLFSSPIGNLDKRCLFPPLCSMIEPSYFRTFPVSSDYSKLPALDFRLRHFPLSEVNKRGWFHLLRGQISINVFTDFQDFANTAHIPYSLAEELFPGCDVPFAAFEGPLLEYFIWPSKLAPIYEISERDIEEGRFKPFIASYPFLVANEEAAVNIGYSAEGFMKQFEPSVPKPSGANRKRVEQLADEVRDQDRNTTVDDVAEPTVPNDIKETVTNVQDDNK